MHGPSKTMGLANCHLISLDTFSCYMHLAVYIFRELSQNLDFVQDQESLEVPICLFVMSEHLASAFKTLKSRSHSLKSQNFSGSERKMLVSASHKVLHVSFTSPPLAHNCGDSTC